MPSEGVNGDGGQEMSVADKSVELVVPSSIATCPEEFDHTSLLASLISLPTSSQSASGDHWLPLASLTPGVVDALQGAKVDKQLAPQLLSCAEAGWPDVQFGPQVDEAAPDWLKEYLVAKRAVDARQGGSVFSTAAQNASMSPSSGAW